MHWKKKRMLVGAHVGVVSFREKLLPLIELLKIDDGSDFHQPLGP